MSLAALARDSKAADLLRRSLERKRLGHAYLIHGTVPEELENIARALAKVLNCTGTVRPSGGQPPLDSCDACTSCRKTENDLHPDIQWVRPESKSRIITVDQVRELMNQLQLKPCEGQYKVGILCSADRLNTQAANAFLKTLEEPPSRCVLILLSCEPDRLLETIRSRCLRLAAGGGDGRPTKPQQLQWLKELATDVASQRGGLLGRYRLLGKIVAELARLKKEIEGDLTSRSPLERYDDLESGLREKWEGELEAAIEAEYRRTRTEVLGGIEWWLRDVWVMSCQPDPSRLALPSLATETAAVSVRIQPTDALSNLHVIERTQRLLFSNVQEALALEVALLRLKL